MKLVMQLGLGPGHIVLDGDRAPPDQKGAEPSPLSSTKNRLMFIVTKPLDGSTWYLEQR